MKPFAQWPFALQKESPVSFYQRQTSKIVCLEENPLPPAAAAAAAAKKDVGERREGWWWILVPAEEQDSNGEAFRVGAADPASLASTAP